MKKIASTILIAIVAMSMILVFTPWVRVRAADGLGEALNFDGTSNCVSVAPVDADVYTFELWFKPDTNYALIGSNRFLIQTSDQSLTVWHDVYGGSVNWYPVPIGTGSWHHLAVIIDYTVWQITPYLDGVSLGAKATTTMTKPSITRMEIGCYANSRFFGGVIDEVRVYNKTLSNAEILAHYNSGVGQYGRPETGLAAGWHFDESSGTTAHDYSENGNDGSVIGATWVDGHVPLPDVAVTDVIPASTKVISGDSVNIKVTVKNLGTSYEDFTVTAYNDSSPIGIQTVTGLTPRATKDLTFPWNTAGVPLGNHTIKAKASTVQGETYTVNNEISGSSIWIVQYPIASFTYSPVPAIENSSTSFDATTSDVRGGTFVNYTWNFDDGNTATTTNPIITHTYASHGTYNVMLKVWDSEDLSNNTWQLVTVLRHDVAIIDVTPYRNWTYEGRIININVTAANFGNFTETATIKLYYNITASKEIGTDIVALDPSETKTLTFAWNTTDVPHCQNYTITATITIAEFDSNTTNNMLESPTKIKVRIIGDINNDDKVSILDVYGVAQCFGKTPDRQGWNPDADINDDGKIDIKDFMATCRNYGKQ